MKILHLTDFHYSNRDSIQTRVVESIIKTINENNIKIQLVFFTGDLVQMGSDISNFRDARTLLFDSIINYLNVNKENIIFCPGNHDIDRNVVHGALKAFIDANILNNESLNAFYEKKKNKDVFIDSLKPSMNYNLFLSEFHPESKENINKELYSIHYRTFKGKKLGIVCLNTAWLCAIDTNKPGKSDKGNLLIPHSLLIEIKRHLTNIDKKIILLHHPLYFLKDFNFNEVENHIHNEFELMFSGHVHKISSISRYTGINGLFEHVAKASLSSKENLGCSLIEIDDIEDNIIRVRELTYISDDDTCHLGKEIVHTVPCGIEKQEIISFRKKIYEKISIEKENANNLLLLKNENEDEDFMLLYNHPVIKKEVEGGLETKNSLSYSLDDICCSKENYVILGKDKCGKTSLLRKIQIECLINFSKNGRIPFYIDARELESKIDSRFDLSQLVRNYFGINLTKTKELLSKDSFLLLIDNFAPNSSVAEYLDKFLCTYFNISFIVCSEYNLSRTVDVFNIGNSTYEKLYFHDLRRKEIIAYTEKRLSSNQKREQVQEKIIQLCKQLELPLNYWTISLLLLIHNKSSDSYSKNLFSILDVCLDEIFAKKQLALSKSRISFEQLKKICAQLAKYLFINHSETIYSASYRDVLTQIENILSENDRISVNSREIFDYLVFSGILKQKNDNDYYVFRLNGFFEYFLAWQMTKDYDFETEILGDEEKYLAFKNQLEIYSGFKRDNLNFLLNVFEKTKSKLNPIFIDYSDDKDNELLEKIQEPKHIEEVCKKLSVKKALTALEKAGIEDVVDELQINADVHEIKYINPNEINSELIERYLSILCRIFRNSDEISGNKETISEIFNFIINRYCDLGFYLIKELSEVTRSEFEKNDGIDFENFPELDLLRFISNFSPLICQTILFDNLGHYNLERMIKEEIKKLECATNENQLKLFLLYFMLLDIDLNSNREYIQTAMNNIRIPVLKYTIFIKLNYYLAFKSANNKALQQELSNKIQRAKLNLDNKYNISDLQKQIQEKKKMSNILKVNI